jgi:hypothetical protein
VSIQRFPLRAPVLLYLAIPLFGAATVGFAPELQTDRGLIINHLIELDVTEARVFFGVLAVFSFAFVVAAMIGIVRMFGGRLAVDLGDETIVVPGRPLCPRAREFHYAEITSATVQTVGKQEFLMLVDARGKESLARSNVGDAAFDTIVTHVRRCVSPRRGALPVAKLSSRVRTSTSQRS